ncbi:hypothetical protein HMPREF9123_1583 [Neisseria bacilliformis ATCC BAA-1200]|uniref:Uncharacterized protein n=1 Tax=Neisseria bacilliformis ATCC BAA-1200 TaxID=888742 RepID=F2BCV3_9NEIS|nr:hypothetical protein HMPREF9123_1583 [Neisseria bacilliformis ATCC BAA-1200]
MAEPKPRFQTAYPRRRRRPPAPECLPQSAILRGCFRTAFFET